MANLFGTVSGDRGVTPRRVYGTLSGVPVRKEVIRAASEVYFVNKPRSPFHKQVTDALLAYDRASWQRNDIAHGIVMEFIHPSTKETKGCFLVPPPYSTKKFTMWASFEPEWFDRAMSQFSYALTAKDVMRQHLKFRTLAKAVRNLSKAIWDQYEVPALRRSAGLE